MAPEAVERNGRYADMYDVELVIEAEFAVSDVAEETEEDRGHLRAYESNRDDMSDEVGP